MVDKPHKAAWVTPVYSTAMVDKPHKAAWVTPVYSTAMVDKPHKAAWVTQAYLLQLLLMIFPRVTTINCSHSSSDCYRVY